MLFIMDHHLKEIVIGEEIPPSFAFYVSFITATDDELNRCLHIIGREKVPKSVWSFNKSDSQTIILNWNSL